MLTPGYLPVLHEDGVTSTVYRPDRLAKQFGYDQGIPGPASAHLGFIHSYKRFASGRMDPYLRKYTRIVIIRVVLEVAQRGLGVIGVRLCRPSSSFVGHTRFVFLICP